MSRLINGNPSEFMPNDDRIKELSIKFDADYNRIRNRLIELLECLEECDNLEDGLGICMALEVYGIFPAGKHPNAPTYQEYQDLLNNLIEYSVLNGDES